ncbi:hypothetical protein PanWU01x14_324670 [Parasponia andersonii]|uniref:Uncharacterized protein n=1 Tax=Parasponia andersonii TaxID=3476 RepID=A0A2P5AK75_PARAD|nr:hypothetical protein PanWU01x14_324670 [Parasponia andersonii]
MASSIGGVDAESLTSDGIGVVVAQMSMGERRYEHGRTTMYVQSLYNERTILLAMYLIGPLTAPALSLRFIHALYRKAPPSQVGPNNTGAAASLVPYGEPHSLAHSPALPTRNPQLQPQVSCSHLRLPPPLLQPVLPLPALPLPLDHRRRLPSC